MNDTTHPICCDVVIPAYQAERHLQETLKSLQHQSFTAWAATVVDDGSTDGTAEAAAALDDPRITVLRQPNAGVCAARNRGLSAGSAPYVLFLDADDCLLTNALGRMVAALEEHPDCVAVYGDAVIMEEAGDLRDVPGRPVFTHRPSGDVLEPLLARNFVFTGALLARRDAVTAAGPFDVRLKLYEDWEFWCRLALQGPFAYLGGMPVLAYRRTAGSAVAALGTRRDEAFKALDAVFDNPEVREVVPRQRLQRLRRRSEASVFSFLGTQHLKARNWRPARRAILESLRRDPRQIREWVLLACALLRVLPGKIRQRLK